MVNATPIGPYEVSLLRVIRGMSVADSRLTTSWLSEVSRAPTASARPRTRPPSRRYGVHRHSARPNSAPNAPLRCRPWVTWTAAASRLR
jgi:hypothetical protein